MTMSRRKSVEQHDELASEFAPQPVPRSYTNAELEDFGKWLDQFREEKELPSLKDKTVKEKVRVLNIRKAAVAAGAMSYRFGNYRVILDYGGNNREGRPFYKVPTRWDVFEDKLEQWQKLKASRENAAERAAEQYESMAEQALAHMQFTPEVPLVYDESPSDEPVRRLTPAEVDAKMEESW